VKIVKSIHINVLVAGFVLAFQAEAKLCNPMKERCWLSGKNSTASPAYPSASSSIKLNPSAVPIDDAWGGEALIYGSSVDFALIKGNGRIGAAISPSNNEETFFGPPGFEMPDDRLARLQAGEKYKSQKVTLATAVGLWRNKRSGLKRVAVNLGVIGKYNRESKSILPGGGLSGVLGPFTFGYAYAKDEIVIEPGSLDRRAYKYWTDIFSGGLNLTSVALDYSHLRVHTEDGQIDSTISLLTASLMLNRWMVTLSSRREDSEREAYDFKQKIFTTEPVKYETFGGVQYAPTKVLLVGVFHNYYLLRELSLGMTLFF